MLKPGERIGRYEVLERIGQGGLASVHRVRHVDLDAIFALKLLEVHRPHLVARLLDEGRAQARLFHPNIARVTDVLLHDNLPVLVMEHVDGPSLDRYLAQQGRPDLGTALHLAIGITRGLRAAHAHGLVHRDIKPANILLAEHQGVLLPKLADFGLVKVLHEDWRSQRAPTRTGVAMGTPEFMAPEQIRDAAGVDHRADLFSLGCVLYLLLVGKQPFVGNDLLRLHEQIAAGAYLAPSERVPGIPPALDRLVVAMLRADPRARPASCDEVLYVLQSPAARVPAGPSTARPRDLQAAARLPGSGWTEAHGAATEAEPRRSSPRSRLLLAAPLCLPLLLALLGWWLGSLFGGPSPLQGAEPDVALAAPAPLEGPAPSPAEPQAPELPDSPPESLERAEVLEEAREDAPQEPPQSPPEPSGPSQRPRSSEEREDRAPPSPRPAEPVALPPSPPESEPDLTEVSFTGEASRVWLVRDGRRVDLPGKVLPGRYEVVALFPSTPPVSSGHVRVGSKAVTLRCSAFALRCRP